MTNVDLVKPEATNSAASNVRTWRFFVDKINAIWRRGAGDFIACGQCLTEAKAELQPDAFNAMVKAKLDFDRSVGVKLMAIAANSILSAHGHKLPPCWTSIYELSKLGDETLKAKLADGTIHPGMQRKDAVALRKPKQQSRSTANNKSEIAAVWKDASIEQRRRFLDQLGRDGLCGAMSEKLKAEFQDAINGAAIAGASESAPFAVYATDKLHCALRCAEQQNPDHEGLMHMAAALGCIAKKASAKGITRSRIVVAEGKLKSKGRN
jgi:hypothetical protein